MELRALVAPSSTPLSGDTIIKALKSKGFSDATTSPTNWKSGQGECQISYAPANQYITLSDTTDTGGRAIVITAHDDLAHDALQVVVETVKSEIGASEIAGY